MGFYGGTGVGLSSSGDAVNIFDAAGDRVTGVAFGTSPSSAPFATFDNTAGLGSTTLPLPTISTLSAVGVNGAYISADDQEIGSPLPVVDTTAPTIVATPSPAANANGWNNTAVTVSFTCTDSGTGVDNAASPLTPVVLTASGTANPHLHGPGRQHCDGQLHRPDRHRRPDGDLLRQRRHIRNPEDGSHHFGRHR